MAGYICQYTLPSITSITEQKKSNDPVSFLFALFNRKMAVNCLKHKAYNDLGHVWYDRQEKYTAIK